MRIGPRTLMETNEERPLGDDAEGTRCPGSDLFSTPSCPGSIVGAEAFHDRVRDGNGWSHLAPATRTYSGRGIRTPDLRVMSPTSCRCSIPRHTSRKPRAFSS